LNLTIFDLVPSISSISNYDGQSKAMCSIFDLVPSMSALELKCPGSLFRFGQWILGFAPEKNIIKWMILPSISSVFKFEDAFLVLNNLELVLVLIKSLSYCNYFKFIKSSLYGNFQFHGSNLFFISVVYFSSSAYILNF